MADDFQLFSSLRYDPILLEVPTHGMHHTGWNSENRSPFYMLDFHRDRMLRAATHWHWDKAIQVLLGEAGLKRLEDFLVQKLGSDTAPKRVKVLLSKEGELRGEFSQTPETSLANLFPSELPAPGQSSLRGATSSPRKIPVFDVVVDEVQTPQSEYTHFKTTKREMYDSARQRARISLSDAIEALLVNEAAGSIMEGTLTTPYFWRNGRWVTPPIPEQYQHDAGSGGQDGTTRRWMLERGLVVEEEVKTDSLVDGEECWLSNGVKGFIFGRLHR